MDTGQSLYVVWHRCDVDGLAHAITDEEFAHGPRRARGLFRAVCGHVTQPGSMLLAPEAACAECSDRLACNRELLAAPQATRVPQQRHGALRRAFARFRSPVVPFPNVVSSARNDRTPSPAGTGCEPDAPVPAGHHGRR